MAEGDRKSQETISDLQLQLENYQNSLRSSESFSENLKNDFALAVEKIKVLEELLGPDRDFPLGVKISKGDDSDSSEISSDTACSSFVVIGEIEEGREGRIQSQSKGGVRGQGQSNKNIVRKTDIRSDVIETGIERGIGIENKREMKDIFIEDEVEVEVEGESGIMIREENDGKDSMVFDSINSTSGSGSGSGSRFDQEPLLSAQASLVSELQDRYKDSQNEVSTNKEIFK